MIKFIKDTPDYWNEEENKLIGAQLFTNGNNGQILLFENFGVCNSNSLTLKSEITNHYTEDNYWINDHWAINPPQYVVSGLIGELIYTVPTGWSKKVESLYGTSGLGLLSVISPTLGSYTSGILNVVRKVQSVVNKYTKIAKQGLNQIKGWLKKGVIKKTNQRRVLDELENLMNNRILVNVQTPYGTYTNLAIVAINITQPQDSKYTSDLEITFQKWRNVGEAFGNVNNEKRMIDVIAAQKAKEKKSGFVGKIKANENITDLNKSDFKVA